MPPSPRPTGRRRPRRCRRRRPGGRRAGRRRRRGARAAGRSRAEPEPEAAEPEPEAPTPFTRARRAPRPDRQGAGAPPEARPRRRAERGARPAPPGQAAGRRRPAPRRRRPRRPLDRGRHRGPRRRGGGRRHVVGREAPAPVADLADELARSLTAPLRDRIDRSFAAADGNLDDVADRVRALYREWKGQRLTDTSRHYAAAAYARGRVRRHAAAAPRSTGWSIPLGGRCPDCDDNVLGGDLEKGTEFPTGHTLRARPTRAAVAWCSRPTADPAPIASPRCVPPTTCRAVRRRAAARPDEGAPGSSSAPSSSSS